MLVIRDTSVVPQEKWHYPVAATGYTVYAPNWPALYSMVEAHCRANNVSVPSEQDVITWSCNNLSVPCYESETRQPLVNKFGLPAKPTPSCCGSSVPLPAQKEAV